MHRSRLAVALIAALTLSPHLGAQDLDTLYGHLEWRNIGPANMSGRVTDIEAVDGDFSTVFVGSASGGVWKSTNAGTTWDQIFDQYGTGNIGDLDYL